MDFNVNVNVKLETSTRLLIQSAILTWMKSMNVDAAENDRASQVLTNLADRATEASEKTVSEKFSEPVSEENEEKADETVDAKETVFTEAMARSARLEAIARVKDSAPEEEKENAEKLAKKIIKNGYLQSAAFEHERNDAGIAVNRGGEPLKTLAELSSNELGRFCELCNSLHWDVSEKTVNPSNAA